MTFSDRFALLALAGTRADRMTDAVSAAARALSVAEAVESGSDIDAAVSLAGRMFRKTVSDILKGRVKRMQAEGLLSEESDLASLEMANARARCMRADPKALRSVLGGIGDRLTEGSLTEEDMTMLWLLREAGALPFLLTPFELETVGGSPALKYFPLWSLMFGRKLELGNVKRRSGDIPVAEDRTEGAFIEGIFLPAGDRMEALIDLLEGRGHDIGTLEEGERPLIRIDGNLYRADMNARKTGRLAIEGISLRPAWKTEGEGK